MAKVLKSAPKTSKDGLSDYATGNAPFWTCKSDGEQQIIHAKRGIAAKKADGGALSKTMGEMLALAAKKKGNKPALRAEIPVPALKGKTAPQSKPRTQWKTWTYSQYYVDCCRAAKGFIKLGLEQHDSVNIFGFNSVPWFVSELGAMIAGGKAAGVYPTDTPDQLQFKSCHSDASIATVETEKEFNKFKEIIDQVPYLKAIVCWAYNDGQDITRSDGSVVKVMTWDDLLKLGEEVDDKVLEERAALIKPEHCATLIYTSGTTGNPKAVMISHDSLCFEATTVMTHLDFIGNKAIEERAISYLPLSHVAGMMVDIIFPIVLSANRPGWVITHFARPYDLKAGTLADRLRAIQPTFFIGVPRVWEKIAEKMKAIGASVKGAKKKISTWAKAKGLAHQQNCQLGGTGAKPFMYGLAEKIVLSKVKQALGLDECKFGFTGAAPITTDTLEYFGALGININEVYGMSECTGAVTWSLDKCHVWGSCGFSMAGCELKIFKVDPSDINKKTECPAAADIFNAKDEEQGEICFRGRNIMMGYLANPKLGADHVAEIKKKNAEAIDNEGWLHSGDMGCVSKTGMVKITGRYKELIIGAGGENIAPVPIEDNLKRLCPFISNVMMVGDKRKFNVMLVTLKVVGATGELPGGDELDGAAASLNPKVKTLQQAMEDKTFIDAITKAITTTNKDGSVVPSNAAKVQKFTILPKDFSVVGGELTATLKLKRSVVAKQYNDVIESMYASSETYIKYP